MADMEVESLNRLYSLRYWKRAWVLQEVELASRATITWVRRSISWDVYDILSALVRFVQYRELQAPANCQVVFARNWALSEPLRGYSLLYILQQTANLEQANPRDAIYAKSRFASDGHFLVPAPEWTPRPARSRKGLIGPSAFG